MLVIVTPTTESILALQDREGALYYSIAAEGVLRREGLISTMSLALDGLASAPAESAFLFTRGTEPRPAQLDYLRRRPLAFEGPLSAGVSDYLGLSGQIRTVERLEISTPDGKTSWTLFRPRVEMGNPRRELALPRLWTAPAIAVQLFADVAPEDTLLVMTLADGTRAPAVFLRNGAWVSALPLFDLIGQHFAFPPLTDRYATRKRPSRLSELGKRLCTGLGDAMAAGATLVSCGRWPAGYSSVFALRHDYDRAISGGEHERLMALYQRHGIKASMGYLGYLLPEGQMRDFAARGHEIQIHVYEHDGPALARSVQMIAQAGGQPVRGATIHGGSTGIGFRGDVTFEWLEKAGLDYTESFSIDGYPSPLYRPDPLGILRRSRLVASPMHISLDISLEPQAHRLELVRRSVADNLSGGLMALPMNHPDIHREELETVVQGVSGDNVWFATLGEVCAWERCSKYDPVAGLSGGTLTLEFGQALPAAAVLTVRQPGRPPRQVTVAAGSHGVVVNAWGGVRCRATPNPEREPAVARLRQALLRKGFLRKTLLGLRYLGREASRMKSQARQGIRRPQAALLVSRVGNRLSQDGENAGFRPATQLLLQYTEADSEVLDILALAAGEVPWPPGQAVLGASLTADLHPVLVAALAELVRQATGHPVLDGSDPRRIPFPPADEAAAALATWIVTQARNENLKRGELAYFLASTPLRARAIAAILDQAVPGAIETLVDHGSGVGLMPWLLSRQTGRIGHVAMVEPTERYSAPMAALWRAGGGVSHECFPVLSEKFEYGGSADVVMICHTLFRVAPEARADVLARAWNALNPGGLLIVNEILTDQPDDPRRYVHRETLVRLLEQYGMPSLFMMDSGWKAPQEPLLPVTEEIGSTGFFVTRKEGGAEENSSMVAEMGAPVHDQPFDPARFKDEGAAARLTSQPGDKLRAILDWLALPAGARVLDAADHMQGEAGMRTAEMLDGLFGGPIHILERRADIAGALATRFAGRAEIHNKAFAKLTNAGAFDLIVLDLVSPVMMQDLDHLLVRARSLLKPGGRLVSFFVYDSQAAFGGEKPALNSALRPLTENFLQSWFGRKCVTVENVRRAFWAKGFAAHFLTDRWSRRTGIGWLVLERL